MLPKPEKTKKSYPAKAEQLDLVNTISSEDKLRHKRRWLFLALFLTIGLSLIFMIYHSLKSNIKNYHFSFPKFSALTTKSLPSPQLSDQLDVIISRQLDSHPYHWSVAVHLPSGSLQNYNWSKSSAPLDEKQISTIITNLSKVSTPNSLIVPYLPQGSQIQEISSFSPNSAQIQSLVSLPHQKILFVVSATGDNLTDFNSLVFHLIPSLYWPIVQSIPVN